MIFLDMVSYNKYTPRDNNKVEDRKSSAIINDIPKHVNWFMKFFKQSTQNP